MTKRVLTQAQAGEIRRLRSELNDWNEPKWTGAEIALHVGCSESTVWRVIGKQAAYAKMGRVEPGGLSMEMAHAAVALTGGNSVLDAEAAASQARFLAQLTAEPLAETPAPVRTPPPSPLDGADTPSETDGSATASLAERARAYNLDIEQLRKVP